MGNRVVIEFDGDTKNFDAQIEEVESKLNDLKSGYEEFAQRKGFNEKSNEARQFRAEIERTENKLADLYKKQQQVGQADMSETKSQLSGVGSSIENVIKKVKKWALAVFGIRSMYMLVRRSMSVLSEYNDQIATDVEYIRFALAMTLQPVIEFIIRLAYKILSIIASIIKLITGKNIFKNAGVDKFNSKLTKTNKEAKKLEKTLAGFDEMNVLQEQSKDTTGAGEDYRTPSADLSKGLDKIKQIDWKKWVQDAWQWIKDNWKAVLIGITAVIGGLLLFKAIRKLFTPLGPVIKGFFKSFGVALEIIAILGGLALVIQSITELIKTFAETGLSVQEVLGLLASVLGTVAVAFAGMALATKLFDIKGIAGAVVILGGLVLVIREISKLLKTVAKAGMDVNDVTDLMITLVGSITALVLALTIAVIALSNPMALVGALALVVAVAGVLLTIKATLPTILDAVGKFTNKVAPPLIAVMNTIGNVIEGIIKMLGQVLPPIIKEVGKVFDTIFKGINNVIKTVSNSIIKVLDKIIWFAKSLGPSIESLVNSIIRAVTRLINFFISGIEYMINSLIIGSIRGLVSGINALLPGEHFDLNAPGYVSIPRFVPRLAKGGIVNMPGKGVPIGGAIAGERAQEGVIPLTDSQQMALLGEAIGKYITVNANITNTMNGRIISRELQKVQNDSNFAFNR